MRHTERDTGRLKFWPPGTGPREARDSDDQPILSPRTGRPVAIRGDGWACPDCGTGLPASPAAATRHLDHQCKEKNQ